MKLRLKAGRNLLLVGDLKVKVSRGTIEIFGWTIDDNVELEIPDLLSVPLVAISDAELDIDFGEEGYIAETPYRLIPESWEEATSKILNFDGQRTVLVIANVDSGKSGFICFLANKALAKGKKVAIINTDSGQSEMNPPTTMGYAIVSKPIYHLSQLRYDEAFFVGSTSPAGLFERTIVGLLRLIEKAKAKSPDIIIINTTGWVHNPGGRELKEVKLIALMPDFVVILEREKDELFYIRTLLEKMSIDHVVIDAAPKLRARSREERRKLRQIYYQREFEGAKESVFLMDDFAFMYSYLGTGTLLEAELLLKIVGILGYKPEIVEKTQDQIIIVTTKQITEDLARKLKEELNFPIKIIDPNELVGLIVGLLREDGFLEALGIIRKFDPETRALTIFTRADPKNVRIIALGRIKLNENFEEVGWIEPWSF